MDNHPSRFLTLPGRIIVFTSLLAGLGATWACHGPLADYVAGGAIWGGLIYFPGFFAAIVFFCAGTTLLQLLGVRFFNHPKE